MIKINTNQMITRISLWIKTLIFFILTTLGAQALWWIAKPLGYNMLENPRFSTNKAEDYASSISNRAAFGIITKEKAAAAPALVDQVKLIGVYAGGAKNSLAFLQISGKAVNVAIGESVLDGKLKAINPNNVVISTQGQDVTIEITSGSANGNQANSPTTPSSNGLSNNPMQTNTPDNVQNNTQPPVPATASNTDTPPSDSGSDTSSIAEKRQKMIQAFQQQNNSNANN